MTTPAGLEASGLYVGLVGHARTRPRRHRLAYRIFMLLIDLDELPGLRALRTATSERLERQEHVGFEVFGRAMDLYFGGDMEAAIALGGQVVGRIEAVKPVGEIIAETVAGFRATIGRLGTLANGAR